MKKQTAVQWLFDEFIKPENQASLASLFLQAIEIENQQIEDAYWEGIFNGEFLDGQGYYNENYGDK
jgi:hypothetical protein